MSCRRRAQCLFSRFWESLACAGSPEEYMFFSRFTITALYMEVVRASVSVVLVPIRHVVLSGCTDISFQSVMNREVCIRKE